MIELQIAALEKRISELEQKLVIHLDLIGSNQRLIQELFRIIEVNDLKLLK